jgi:hypothetical protein
MKKFWIAISESELEKFNSLEEAKEDAETKAVSEEEPVIILEAISSCQVEIKHIPVEP